MISRLRLVEVFVERCAASGFLQGELVHLCSEQEQVLCSQGSGHDSSP